MLKKTTTTTLCILAGLISSLSLASTSYAANGNQSTTLLKGGVSASSSPSLDLPPNERLGYILGGLNTPGAFPDVSFLQTDSDSRSGNDIQSPHMMAGIKQPAIMFGESETRSSFTRGSQRSAALRSGYMVGELDTPGGFPRF